MDSRLYGLGVADLYSKYSSNTHIGGGSVGGKSGGEEVGGLQEPRYTPTSMTTQTGSIQSELNDVFNIGLSKKANFEVGCGGTNNPDNHKLFDMW